jgi:hypothetical protein
MWHAGAVAECFAEERKPETKGIMRITEGEGDTQNRDKVAAATERTPRWEGQQRV